MHTPTPAAYQRPVLAARSLPKGWEGSRVPLTFRVEGGLHMIRGNRAPYFTLTYTQHRKGFPDQCYSGGAGHREILRHFPRFADLAALHLADIDGVPMRAEANGWYQLAGALGGAGERFHGGNSDRQHWKPDGTFDGYRHSTPAECLQAFADHCRIPIEDAASIRAQVHAAAVDVARDVFPDWKYARTVWAALCEAMRPRWKAEAEAAIAAHHLTVYGDPWPPVDALGRTTAVPA